MRDIDDLFNAQYDMTTRFTMILQKVGIDKCLGIVLSLTYS